MIHLHPGLVRPRLGSAFTPGLHPSARGVLNIDRGSSTTVFCSDNKLWNLPRAHPSISLNLMSYFEPASSTG